LIFILKNDKMRFDQGLERLVKISVKFIFWIKESFKKYSQLYKYMIHSNPW
jgi:hypothetical protein